MTMTDLELDTFDRRYTDRPLGLDWLEGAACAGRDVETFFPGGGCGSNKKAKSICAGCPVVADCLEYAMERPWLAGVWGGMSAHQRRDLRREQERVA